MAIFDRLYTTSYQSVSYCFRDIWRWRISCP